MEQIDFTEPSFRYIIDTSSILSQKIGEPHTRQVYRSQWKTIDESIKNRLIVTCSEIVDEIKDDEIQIWLKQTQCAVLSIDEEIQDNVRRIVTEHPKMIDFTKCKSSGDAFLIATAMKYKLSVITEENDKRDKIPDICKCYNIPCYNITTLCTHEKWEF